ncbi:unnamed protein product [Haemonchus placei]|uniref:CUB domain-containing protein n=1 Tax=Haemonchus placei TaxID=6290 RepID=A0A0N4WZR8_HAEPC|nr:unnamed protein product [Haemonchus placei]
MDDRTTGRGGEFSLRANVKNGELDRNNWYFHAEPDCGRTAGRGSARIDVERIQPHPGEVIVERYDLN